MNPTVCSVGIVEMKIETAAGLSELPVSWKRETSKQTNTIDKLEGEHLDKDVERQIFHSSISPLSSGTMKMTG